jgi:hypothetical protein
VPRYWELADGRSGSARDRVIALVLDPLGPLFSEPERLLMEESPSALDVRPLLDVIGGGAHRLSEIAGRLGRPATSLARPLDRLLGMGLIRRDVPYGEPLRGGKRSHYRMDDPFLRLWFRVVAPNRAALSAGTRGTRAALLDFHWEQLRSQAWGELCRAAVPQLSRGALARLGPWQPAQRYWHGNAPEWDVVADAVDGKRVLVGEAWFSSKPPALESIRSAARAVGARALPPVEGDREVVRALFLPTVPTGMRRTVDAVHLITQQDLL